jgi:hypothetical protein
LFGARQDPKSGALPKLASLDSVAAQARCSVKHVDQMWFRGSLIAVRSHARLVARPQRTDALPVVTLVPFNHPT